MTQKPLSAWRNVLSRLPGGARLISGRKDVKTLQQAAMGEAAGSLNVLQNVDPRMREQFKAASADPTTAAQKQAASVGKGPTEKGLTGKGKENASTRSGFVGGVVGNSARMATLTLPAGFAIAAAKSGAALTTVSGTVVQGASVLAGSVGAASIMSGLATMALTVIPAAAVAAVGLGLAKQAMGAFRFSPEARQARAEKRIANKAERMAYRQMYEQKMAELGRPGSLGGRVQAFKQKWDDRVLQRKQEKAAKQAASSSDEAASTWTLPQGMSGALPEAA